MNFITKKVGVAALVVALICNLQYSFFSGAESPDAAKAGWTDMYGTAWCGDYPSTVAYPGEWYYLETYDGSGNEDYDFYNAGYIWYFIRNNTATSECAPNENPSPYANYHGYYVTVPKPSISF